MFCKVKGHVTETDVISGAVQKIDKIGNDAADELARQGAAAHAVPDEVRREVQMQRVAAKGVQRMMLEIIIERRAAEAAGGAMSDGAEELEHEFAMLGAEAAAARSEASTGNTGLYSLPSETEPG